MTCVRCSGFLNRERIYDFFDDTGQFEFWGWCCLNCGAIIDTVIAANRRQTKPTRAGQADAHKHPIAA